MDRILDTLIEILASSGIIWAATLACKQLFRSKLSPRAHVAIWLVLIARLVLPVTFDTGLHLIEIPAAGALETAAAPVTPEAEMQLHRGAAAPTDLPRVSAAVPPETSAASAAEPAASTWNFDVSLPELAVGCWVLGILAAGAVSMRAYENLRRDVRSRLVSGWDPLHRLFQECLRELGIRKRVALAVQSELAGPALMFPNIVLVPENLLGESDEKIRMVLRHELTHFVRGDQWRAFGLSLLRTVWWFNPVVWMAVREIREDMETACDSDVVRRLSAKEKAAYAGTVLAMFGRTETNQAVLGMAFGGARRNAERRIRGIYMKPKCKPAGRAAALLLAGVLGVACFTTACQPTPAAQAVVNQKEGIPEDALVGQSETVSPQATTAPAARYTAAERWKGTIDKANNFQIVADVDVLTPDVEAYPVEKLAPRDLSQELADQLISYFAPNTAFYQPDQRRTKSDLEQLILDARQALAADQELGNQEAIAEDQAFIDELTAMYENAPEELERKPASTEFTYTRDYTGAVMEEEGPNYIDVWADAEGGGTAQISVRRRNPNDAMQFPYFMYTSAVCTTEAEDLAGRERVEMEREWARSLSEPYRSEELERLDAYEEKLSRQLPLYAQMPDDLSSAKQHAEQLLADLDIRGVQIVTVDKALWAPYSGSEADAESEMREPGVYLEFQRENGGIPCISQLSQSGTPDVGRREYSAPFTPEHGTILFDSEGNVRMFTWESPTQPVEIVAPDSKLIPLSEAKEKLTEELYRNELAVSAAYIEEFGLAYDVEEVKLVMGFVDIPDDPDNALAVPAWYLRAQGRQLEPNADGTAVLYNTQEIMVNALDGAPILMPGSVQSYNYDPEENG